MMPRSPTGKFSPGASSVENGRLGLERLLARTPDLDAVYFSNDDMALGGYFHCLARGISIPSEARHIRL